MRVWRGTLMFLTRPTSPGALGTLPGETTSSGVIGEIIVSNGASGSTARVCSASLVIFEKTGAAISAP